MRARSGNRLLVRRRILAIRETGISQSGTDGQDSPPLKIPHEGYFREALNDGVIVHQYRRVVPLDPGNGLRDGLRKIEAAAFPISRKVLRAFFDCAIGVYDTGTGDTDERRNPELFCFSRRDQLLQHPDEFSYSAFA